MTGPRLCAPLTLAALLLLPACTPRQPIPSDPPDVRTEAQVRGKAARVVMQEPVQEAAATPVEPARQPMPTAVPQSEAKAEAKAVEAKAETKVAEPKTAGTTDAAKAAQPVQPAAQPGNEAKSAAPVAAKATEPKTDAANPATVKAEMGKGEAIEAKPTVPAAKAEGTPQGAPEAKGSAPKSADAAQPVAEGQQAAPKPILVQIASFSTEKNANGALAWLKDKGYQDARVVRVEQGQAVFHRVQAGPFQDLAAARKALEELKGEWPQAFIPAD